MPKSKIWKLFILPAKVYIFLGLVAVFIVLAHARVVHFGINVSASLPYKYFFSTSLLVPSKGGLVVFTAPTTAFPDIAGKKPPFVKRVLGVAGDEIVVEGRYVFVGGTRLYAKPKSQKGRSLAIIQAGRIPPGKLFVFSPHKDSYDSRYQEIGLIDKSQVVGRAWGFGKRGQVQRLEASFLQHQGSQESVEGGSK